MKHSTLKKKKKACFTYHGKKENNKTNGRYSIPVLAHGIWVVFVNNIYVAQRVSK